MFQEFFTSEALLTFDMEIYKFAEKLWGTVMDPIMIFFTHLGDEGIFWIALSVVLLLFKKTRKLGLASLISIVCVSFMNSIVLKDLFGRLRPYLIDSAYWERVATDGWHYTMPFENLKEKSFSFPSGHTATSFGAAFGIFYIDKKKGIVPLILAALIGFSRIYIHVHYPSDVIGGVITGILFSLIACLIVFKLFGKYLDRLNEKCKYKLFPVAETATAQNVQTAETAVEAETETEAEVTETVADEAETESEPEPESESENETDE
ncbi:MAG: phosphatase PAP2 family protein [Acutalibacteraceae bacterium]